MQAPMLCSYTALTQLLNYGLLFNKCSFGLPFNWQNAAKLLNFIVNVRSVIPIFTDKQTCLLQQR